MEPATLQKILNSTGLFLDLIGAGLLAVEIFRRFHGIKILAPQTYLDLKSAPKESPEFKTWEHANFRFHFWGFIFLFVGFLLQFASNWVDKVQSFLRW